MKDLIEALTIFLKYGNPHNPTTCSHDVLYVAIDPALVSKEDKKLLNKFSFIPDEENGGGFLSFRFGSC